jgi:hypothetical protein
MKKVCALFALTAFIISLSSCGTGGVIEPAKTEPGTISKTEPGTEIVSGSSETSPQSQEKENGSDKQKEQDQYYLRALEGDPEALYWLSSSEGITQKQSTLLLKAASSLDYSADYFSMVYEGLDAYSASGPKLKAIERLTDIWNSGNEAPAVQLRKSIRGNQYFPESFVEELVKASYTYSYHAFAEKYGIRPNRSYEAGNGIKLYIPDDDMFLYAENMVEQYLEYEACEFYEFDFDGDGESEIGIPLHSGAGGAFMMDGFGIFKKNSEGLYFHYASGPDCTLRDGMRLIKYDGRIYFITNPYSDTMNEPHNITARVLDENGQGHDISIRCTEYEPREIMTKVYDVYDTSESSGFVTDVMAQAFEAIAATKKHEVYSPNLTKQVRSAEAEQDRYFDSTPTDVYFAADIDNDGTQEFIRKGHVIVELKYYDDYNLFQVYDSEGPLLENAEQMLDILPQDEYYGLHSGGNLYDILPVEGKIVQFWTREKDNLTYCIALTRNTLLYGLHVYKVENGDAVPVCLSLIFDEVQDVEIVFQ